MVSLADSIIAFGLHTAWERREPFIQCCSMYFIHSCKCIGYVLLFTTGTRYCTLFLVVAAEVENNNRFLTHHHGGVNHQWITCLLHAAKELFPYIFLCLQHRRPMLEKCILLLVSTPGSRYLIQVTR